MPVPAAYSRFLRLLALRDRLAGLRIRGRRPARRPGLERLEDRVVPDGRPLPLPTVFVGNETGGAVVRSYDVDTGALNFTVTAGPAGYAGGVRVAAADLNADMIPDVVAAPGAGGGSDLEVFDGTTGLRLAGPLGRFAPFGPFFPGGAEVAVGDVDGDAVPDVVAAAGTRVVAVSGRTGAVLADFDAGAVFVGGGTVRLAAADFTADGRAEVVVGAGPGAPPRVAVLDLKSGTPAPARRGLGGFDAYEPGFTGGVWVATGDVNGDGLTDVVTGPGKGRAPEVRVFSGSGGVRFASFPAFDATFEGGVRVGTVFADHDRYADVVAATGPGGPAAVRVFSAGTGTLVVGPLADFPLAGTTGVSLAAANDPGTGIVTLSAPIPDPSILITGQQFSLSTTITPATLTTTPTGTVAFYADDGTNTIPLGTATVVPATSPTATATLIVSGFVLPAATYSYVAVYSGDAVYASASETGSGVQSVESTRAPAPVVLEGPVRVTVGGVRVIDGGFGVVRADLAGGGFGTPWGATWTWSNGANYSDGSAGLGATLTPLPRLVQANGTDSLALLGSATDARFYDLVAGNYLARYGDLTTFVADTGAGTFVVTAPDGTVSTFYDFSGGTPTGRGGTLISVADPAGNLTEVTAWTGAGQPSEIERTVGSGGSAVTESFLYTYVSGGVNDGRVGSVTLRRKVGAGSWATVRSVAYTYHDGTTSDGLAGDLKLAVVSDAASNPIDTSYYRYYTSSSSPGYAHGLKYAFGPAAYARLTAALGTGVSALTDAQVDDYADEYLEYDSSRRVTKRVAAGAGGAAAGGLGQFTYAYTTSTAAPGGTNAWRYKTVETLPDGNTTTYYANAAGAVMLRAFTDVGLSQTWVTATRYDAVGRAVLEAAPSAVTGYSDTYADLLNDVGGNLQYLADSAGLVTAYEYAATTTATTSAAGDAAGYLKAVSVRRGEGGTAVPQESRTYIETPAGTLAPAGTTVYRNDNGTGGITTTTTYTWQGSTARPDAVTTTLPVVTTGQNGSGSATSTVTVLDTFGRPVWAKDPAGFLTYTEYDPVTGAVTKTIADVDVTQTTTFSGLPSGWTTPAGGGAHLTTAVEVDALGRATKVTRPGGRVDYTVYLDAAHEVRSYPAWDTTTNAPTGPTTVVREDRGNGYAETFTMTATPAVSGSRPTGGETVGALQSLSRTHVNAAGQPVYSDAYFDLSGLTYTTSASLGTSGTNFYRTTTAYDARGRADRSVTPLGTITRTVYDGLGRAVGVWVGTDDTPTTGNWSPTNTTGTNLVLVREDEYDAGGVGDGNLTETTAYPGLSAAARVTQTYYDWRNRAVAVKAGVEGSEGTGVNRPITYTDYDNLGRATAVRVYDGDGVTVTSTSGVPNAPSSSLLRAKTETSYDELGRVYRADTSSVDPSSGSVGSYTLHSQTWYDARGLVIKAAAPGGLVTKSVYDGVGRVIAVYTTDGGGDSAYGDADDVTGDKVLDQVETGYDTASRVNRRTTRARNHDETGTGTLAGLGARVSYLGFYYDLADRPVATVDIGTSPGTVYSWPSSAPASTDTVLVSTTAYAADAVQTVRLTGGPTGGTFTLTFGGQTTSGIAYNASAATVQTAVQALTSVGSGNALVTTAPGGGWLVRFAGSLAAKFAAKLTASGAGLTGGTAPAVAVAVVSAGGDAGRVQAATDPLGRVARTYYDALGRPTRTVEHFTDGAVTDTTDKTTDTAYNAAGRTGLTVYLTGGGSQTTEWVYGVTTGGGSGVTSNDVVGATRWPDATTGAASGSEQETVTVNALGQTATSTDRNGTVHTLTYDVLGRATADAVTTLGSGVDGAVRRIETAYDGRGNAYLVTSYDAASSGSVVNQVQRGYNGLGQLVTEWQAHGGAVNTSTSPKVQSAYSEMPSGANHSRLTSATYPNGYVVNSTYASGLDATISRLSSLTDTTGTLDAYSYLGLGTVVVRSHPQPDLDLTYVKRSGESNGDAGDQYTGLDRFGRVVDQRWLDGSSGVATDRHQYGYDRAGNRVYRDNLVSAGFGEVYTYDGLNQLASFARGTLNGTKTGVSGVAARTQAWDYDGVGNWDGIDVDGVTQSRTANRQNEVTAVGGATTPGYDANGNTTQAENGLRYVYDAWNRLVAVKNSAGTTTLATYAYDGLNRRVTSAVGGTTTDLYYSSGWQVVEEQVGGATASRYVWSPVYVDALVLRDRDTNADGTPDERLWVQQDANWNVTALVDGSGVVQERNGYDPFGLTLVLDANWAADADGQSDVGWVYAHQGLRWDGTATLYDNRERWYSPTLGRFTSLDPIRYAAGDVNLYRYVGNGPIGALDPEGLFELPPWIRRTNDTVSNFVPFVPNFAAAIETQNPVYLLPGGNTAMNAVNDFREYRDKGAEFFPAVFVAGGRNLPFSNAVIAAMDLYNGDSSSPAYVGTLDAKLDNWDRAGRVLTIALEIIGAKFTFRGGRGGRLPSKSCFPAGTPIHTADGLRVIEQVAVGDRVWAYDHKGLRWATRQVVEVYTLEHKGTMATLRVRGETTRATGGHPFWVVRGDGLAGRPVPVKIPAYEASGRQEGRWVLARDLQVGDELLLRDCSVVPVDSLILTEVTETVYNFHVAELQNYAVGECGVLVHNTNDPPVSNDTKPHPALGSDTLPDIDLGPPRTTSGRPIYPPDGGGQTSRPHPLGGEMPPYAPPPGAMWFVVDGEWRLVPRPKT